MAHATYPQEKIVAAALQVPSVYMDRGATVERLCEAILQAGRLGAHLVVTPETGVPGYPYFRGAFGYTDLESARLWRETVISLQENALRIPSPDVARLGRAAREAGCWCVIGCQELDDRPGSRTLYNTMLFLDPRGEVAGRHRKLMPTHSERLFWGRGDAEDLRVFETEFGPLGGLICYENHMTLLKAALAAKGERVHAANWPGWWDYVGEGRNIKDMSGRPPEPPYGCDVDCAVREYAFETQTFVVSCAAYQPPSTVPESFPYRAKGNWNWAQGGSAIANPFGAYLAGPVFGREAIVAAELDLRDIAVAKNIFDCMGHYARWDVVSLRLRERDFGPAAGPSPWEGFPAKAIERVAERFDLSAEKLEAILEALREREGMLE